MECTFFGRFAEMENFIFAKFRRVHLVIPAKAGIHFYRQISAFTSFFAKKCAGNSKLNFRVKFAEIPKLISPNRFPLSRE